MKLVISCTNPVNHFLFTYSEEILKNHSSIRRQKGCKHSEATKNNECSIFGGNIFLRCYNYAVFQTRMSVKNSTFKEAEHDIGTIETRV